MARTRVVKAPVNLRTGSSASVTGAAASSSGVKAKKIAWGKGDKLPVEILTAILESGTARSCWDKIDAFIQADGFSNLEAAAFKVNPFQTADDLLERIAGEFSYLPAIALRVKYSLGLAAAEVYHVPINTVRKLEDGKFLVNPTLGTDKYKQELDEILDAFNPDPDAISAGFKRELQKAGGRLEDMQQGGQLWFIYRPLPGAPEYPVPDYWTLSGAKDIRSDAEISVSDYDNIFNNFQPSVIIGVPGEYDNVQVKEDTGKTELEEVLDYFGNMLDPENRNKGLVINYKTKEQAVELTPWDNTKGILSLDAKRETIANAVCRHMGVPPILVGLYKAGALSQSKEILNAIALFQFKINRAQRVIQRVFERLFPNPDPSYWVLSTATVLNEIPAEVMATLTADEKRALGGYPAIEAPQSSEAEATIKALSVLSPLVATKVLEEMTSEEIRALVNLKGSKPTTDANNESGL